MFNGLSVGLLIGIFLGAALLVWIAGVFLSETSDTLSERLGWGEALGGLVLLSFATNLPEIAITVTAALSHNLDIAVANILGGIAIQTVVLVILDGAGVPTHPLTYRAASLVLVLEGALVIGVLAIVVMATQLPPSFVALRIAPGSLLVAVLWLIGLYLVHRARDTLPWREQGDAPGAQREEPGVAMRRAKQDKRGERATIRVAAIFGASALATLIAGVVLEQSGDRIAIDTGLSGVIFGSTFLAAATALPELSTGLEAVRLGDYKLAFSDIFGGNAFLPVLFLVATLISGDAVLPRAHKSDIYLTSLGILLTMIYIWGLIFRPTQQYFRLGIDSILVLVTYVAGIAGLIAVAHG